jgi:hypothetical protein
MTLSLPPSIAHYFAGKNARDFAAAAAGFAPAAVVTDEERRHEGPEAIRRWMEATSALYHDQSAVKSVSTEGNTTQVTAEVSGMFPGSPILLRYTFTLDGEQISRLDITG